MKTLEVLIAVVLTFAFLLFLIPRVSHEDKKDVASGLLNGLEGNDDFRYCAIGRNVTCVDDIIGAAIPKRFGHRVSISGIESGPLPSSAGDVYTDSIFIAGTNSEYNATTVKIYYYLP